MKLLKKEKNNKSDSKKKSQLVIVGSLILIIGGFSLIGYKYYNIYCLNKQDEIQAEEFIDNQQNIQVAEDTTIDTETKEEKSSTPTNTEDYVAVIEIPKISLKKGIYGKESSNNNVNKNIEILDEADYPDKVNGNFILAGHSGSGRTAYFKNLHKLENGDIAYIYYLGGRYAYRLINSYEIDKTGTADIIRNGKTTSLTLITCKHNSNKQIVFIFELMKDGVESE